MLSSRPPLSGGGAKKCLSPGGGHDRKKTEKHRDNISSYLTDSFIDELSARNLTSTFPEMSNF